MAYDEKLAQRVRESLPRRDVEEKKDDGRTDFYGEWQNVRWCS